MTKLVFESLDHAQQNFAMLELIPDTHAWVKDTAGRFVYGNPLFYERFGISALPGLLGKSDFDLAPAQMAKHYVADDAFVLGGGVVTDRLEMISDKDGAMAWFLTSKWPVYNPQDQVIGSLGISRHLNRAERQAAPFRELREPIDYIHQHFDSELSVQALASACNISVSALERRFRKHLQKTPHQYINEVRLEHARELLVESGKSIGTIALETGFADHSHFTRAFSRYFGTTPSRLRQRET